MNTIQRFRSVLGVGTTQTRIFQHQLFIDPGNHSAQRVAADYVAAMAEVCPTFKTAIIPQKIGGEPAPTKNWTPVVESGIQVLLPIGFEPKKPIAILAITPDQLTDDRMNEIQPWLDVISRSFGEIWFVLIGDISTHELSAINDRFPNRDMDNTVRFSFLVVPQIGADGSVQTAEDVIQTAVHAMMLPVLCNTDGERFLDGNHSNGPAIRIVESAGVLGSTQRTIQQVLPIVLKQIVEAAKNSDVTTTFPTAIAMLNQSVRGTLPFQATPSIVRRDDQFQEFETPSLIDMESRFTLELFKPSESAKISSVPIHQRVKWLAEFSNLVTEVRVDGLSELIGKRFREQFDDSRSKMMEQMAHQLLHKEMLLGLGDKCKGLIAARRAINFSAGNIDSVSASLSDFEQSIQDRRTIFWSSAKMIAFAVIKCAVLIAVAIHFGRMLPIWITVGTFLFLCIVLAIRCILAHRTMIRHQNQALENIQRQAQSRICGNLHQLIGELFSTLEAQIDAGIRNLQSAGRETQLEIARGHSSLSLSSGARFRDIPVSIDLSDSCCRLFVSEKTMEKPSATWSKATDQLVQSIGLKVINGLSPRNAVIEIRRSIKRMLRSKMPPADLWRSFSCKGNSELDRSKLNEFLDHCRNRFSDGAGSQHGSPARFVQSIWLLPQSLVPHCRLDGVPYISSLADRMVCLRIRSN